MRLYSRGLIFRRDILIRKNPVFYHFKVPAYDYAYAYAYACA